MSLTREVITVDGLAACGKSSISSALAKELGYIHLGSGLIYRALAWLTLKSGLSTVDEAGIAKLLQTHSLGLAKGEDHKPQVILDSALLTIDLETPEISKAASELSQFCEVRRLLLPVQRDVFPGYPLVAEGRDMGTIVFPQAKHKFFINVPVQVRAERRAKQLEASGRSVTVAEITQQIEERDARDSQRLVAPTTPAADAIMIVNDGKTLEEVVGEMLGYI